MTVFLTFSLAYTYHCFCDVPILSGSLYVIYSGILSDIRFDIPSGIIWQILTLKLASVSTFYWHLFWHSLGNYIEIFYLTSFLPSILTFLSGILSGIPCGINSNSLSDILCVICSGPCVRSLISGSPQASSPCVPRLPWSSPKVSGAMEITPLELAFVSSGSWRKAEE